MGNLVTKNSPHQETGRVFGRGPQSSSTSNLNDVRGSEVGLGLWFWTRSDFGSLANAAIQLSANNKL